MTHTRRNLLVQAMAVTPVALLSVPAMADDGDLVAQVDRYHAAEEEALQVVDDREAAEKAFLDRHGLPRVRYSWKRNAGVGQNERLNLETAEPLYVDSDREIDHLCDHLMSLKPAQQEEFRAKLKADLKMASKAWDAAYQEAPCGTLGQREDALYRQCDDLYADIIARTAKTPDGVAAKLTVLERWLDRENDKQTGLLASLANDLAALGAGA